MRLSLDNPDRSYIIRGYDATQAITVNDKTYRHSLIVMPERLLTDWLPASYPELSVDHMSRLLELQPELILLGTGERQIFPHPALTRPLLSAGIGVEVMDTNAACRTYNVIMAEGRHVLAALFLA